MTLSEFFTYLNTNPNVVLIYFLIVPITALLLGWITRGEGHLNPWKYLYAVLVYAVAVPGIFVVALGIYLFLFERGMTSVFSMNLLTQVLPVLSMFTTLSIVRRNAPFEYIPGFGKLSSLMVIIGAVFGLMYIMERARIFIWINMPVHIFLLTIAGLIILVRFALKNLIK